jgi:hypothetical protein
LYWLWESLGVQAGDPDSVVVDDRVGEGRRDGDYRVFIGRPEGRARGEFSKPLDRVIA